MADSLEPYCSLFLHNDVSSKRRNEFFCIFYFIDSACKLSNKYLFINIFKKYSLDSFLNLLNGIGFRSSTSRNELWHTSAQSDRNTESHWTLFTVQDWAALPQETENYRRLSLHDLYKVSDWAGIKIAPCSTQFERGWRVRPHWL